MKDRLKTAEALAEEKSHNLKNFGKIIAQELRNFGLATDKEDKEDNFFCRRIPFEQATTSSTRDSPKSPDAVMVYSLSDSESEVVQGTTDYDSDTMTE